MRHAADAVMDSLERLALIALVIVAAILSALIALRVIPL